MPERIPKPPREDLIDCRRERMLLEDIAEIYQVSVSTVKRWMRSEKLTNIKKPKKTVITMYQPPLNKMASLLDQAKEILGKRVTEHKIRGYMLDGRPATADKLITVAGLRS